MAAIDSGTETLFSDDSASELLGSQSGDELETRFRKAQYESRQNKVAPPNIQPCSGVLEQGKMVVRPIAFKPVAMTPSRFGLNGERYGSTPVLTRPNSRLTYYGSTIDLHQSTNVSYSLDRKLRSSCQSTSSSPPLALTSLPHKLSDYDSLESVRRSPVANTDNSLINKCSYRAAGGGSLLDLTPSPSDSGISELEAALRDRDSELAYLRQTMEHNEQVIFRVYQEKEKVWERELRRLKNIYENRLRTSAQKAIKLDQLLMMLTKQYQQDKQRICAETQRIGSENEKLNQEIQKLRNRLEETEWGLCQKTGEASFLKTQIKDLHIEHTAKSQEILQLRNENRDLNDQLDEKGKEITRLQDISFSKVRENESLKNGTARQFDLRQNSIIHSDLEKYTHFADVGKLKDYREEQCYYSLNNYETMESGRMQRSKINTNNQEESVVRNEQLCPDLENFQKEIEQKTREFESERRIWAQEKEKVLKYQRQLQMNYINMYKRTRSLEAEVEKLTTELELDRQDNKNNFANDLNQTIDL